MKNRDYEIFVRDCGFDPNPELPKYKIMQFVLYRVKNTNKWVIEKRGMVGNDIRSLIREKNNSKLPKPKKIKLDIYPFDMLPIINKVREKLTEQEYNNLIDRLSSSITVDTDKVEITTTEGLENYKIFSPEEFFRKNKINKG